VPDEKDSIEQEEAASI